MKNWLKKINSIDSNQQNLEKKIEDVDKKIPGTGKFIVTQDASQSTKVNFKF